MQLLFEVKQADLAAFHAAALRLGITPVAGYAEVPMQGGTVCLTMEVPANIKGNLKQLPGVVGTFSNSRIEPCGPPGV